MNACPPPGHGTRFDGFVLGSNQAPSNAVDGKLPTAACQLPESPIPAERRCPVLGYALSGMEFKRCPSGNPQVTSSNTDIQTLTGSNLTVTPRLTFHATHLP